MRTTVDIDENILKELRKIQKKEGRSLGRLVSDLLTQALGERKSTADQTPAPHWISKDMGPRIDLANQDAVNAALEQDPKPSNTPESK